MALVRVSLLRGRPAELRRKIGDAIHRALVETMGVPPRDRLNRANLVYDAEYLGIARSDQIVMVQITLTAGRNLAALGVRREDAWVNLVEVAKPAETETA